MNKLSLGSTRVRWLAGIAALLVVVIICIAFFPWDVLRQPINRYVSAQLGRRFEITQHLDVRLGRTTTVMANEVEIANPNCGFFKKIREICTLPNSSGHT